MVSDESAIRLDCKRLGKTYYFCTWTPQKTLSVRFRSLAVRFRSPGSVLGSFWVRFGSVFFKSLLPACMGSTIFQNDRKHFRSKKPTFLTPKWPQKEHFLALYSLLSVLWPFRSQFVRISGPSEFRKRPVACACLTSGTPSTKTTTCVTLKNL